MSQAQTTTVEPNTTTPIGHYRANKQVYDRLSDHVEATTSVFADAPRNVQTDLLHRAVTFALISAQTSVELHEHGYLDVMNEAHTDRQALERALLENGVNYYKNKARYIHHNATAVNYDAILSHYDSGDIDAMHRAIADRCLGVGLRKAGFAMALVVTTEKACLDTHVAQMAGIDSDDIYNGVVVEKYEDQWDTILNQWPELSDQLSKFIFQWVLFSAHRGEVTTHDVWFESVEEVIGQNI
jgi:thermostable 8-oxoguanine DNA glycosylase